MASVCRRLQGNDGALRVVVPPGRQRLRQLVGAVPGKTLGSGGTCWSMITPLLSRSRSSIPRSAIGESDSRGRGNLQDGTQVVMGPHASDWRATLTGSTLEPAEVQRIWGKLSDQVAVRDASDVASSPPPSVNSLAAVAAATVLVALAGLLAALWLVRLPGPPAVAVAAQGALFMVGLLVRTTHRLSRYPLIGARVGVGFGFALTLGLTVFGG